MKNSKILAIIAPIFCYVITKATAWTPSWGLTHGQDDIVGGPMGQHNSYTYRPAMNAETRILRALNNVERDAGRLESVESQEKRMINDLVKVEKKWIYEVRRKERNNKEAYEPQKAYEAQNMQKESQQVLSAELDKINQQNKFFDKLLNNASLRNDYFQIMLPDLDLTGVDKNAIQELVRIIIDYNEFLDEVIFELENEAMESYY